MDKKRSIILNTAIIFAFVAIFLRLVDLQVINGAALKSLGERQSTVISHPPFRRGDIYDSNGMYLAVDKDAVDVFLNTDDISNDCIEYLTRLLGVSSDYCKAKISNHGNGGLLHFGVVTREELSANNRGLSCRSISLNDTFNRTYPWGAVCSELTGVTGSEREGLEGIEYLYNSRLGKQRQGYYVALTDAAGNILNRRFIGSSTARNENIKLNIDIVLSAILTNVLSSYSNKSHAASSFASIIDIDNNELVAEVSLPNFDPNDRKTFNSVDMANRNVRQVFNPGASLDVFLYLNDGFITPDSLLFDGRYHSGYKVIDSDRTLNHIMKNNDNFHTIVLSKGIDLDSIGKRVNIDYSGQDSGYVPSNVQLRNLLKNKKLIGNYAITNVLQMQKVYVQALFHTIFEPKVISTGNAIGKIANHRWVDVDNILLYLKDKKTTLGTEMFRSGQHYNKLNMVIGWFYVSDKKYLLTVGLEYKGTKYAVDPIKTWIDLKYHILNYEYDRPAKLQQIMVMNEAFFDKLKTLDNSYEAIKHDITSSR